MLPTRSIMRLGIVSSGSGGSSCSDGLMDWCRDRFHDDDEIVSGPRSIEVFDNRTVAYQPPNEEIASLADDTGHRVRWFSFGPTVNKDLVIVDQLGDCRAFSRGPRVEITYFGGKSCSEPSTDGPELGGVGC